MNALLLLLLWLQEPPKAVLAGHVLNSATGAPVAKAKVELYREADMQNFLVPASIATMFSDATGAFEFTNLAAGNYVVEPDKDGYMIAVGSDRLHTLDDGQKKDNVVLRLAPFGVITGRVRDEEGEPVPHMFVSAMVFSYAARGRILTARASATTDDRGEYRMFEVQPGRYCIGAGPVFARPKSAGDDTSYQTSYFPGVIDPTAATLVELGPGQQLSGINFVLHRAHLTTIRGRLIAPPEAMRPFLQIATFNGLGGAIATSDWPLNRDHSFVISGLAKGSYELFAGYQMGDRHYAVNMPLELGSEDISGLELRPAPPSSLAGRVRVEGGNVSPSRLQVSLNSGSRTTEAAWVHEDGNFVLPDVTPGAYIVYLNGLDGVYLKAVYWGPGGHGAELVDQHIDLTKGVPANTELSIVVGADPGQIIGTVRDADLKAVIGAWVVLASPAAADRRHAFFAISDQAGRYTFNNLPPGDYKLYSWRDQIDSGRAEHDATYLAPVESEGQDVHVDPHSQQALDTKVIDKRPI